MVLGLYLVYAPY